MQHPAKVYKVILREFDSHRFRMSDTTNTEQETTEDVPVSPIVPGTLITGTTTMWSNLSIMIRAKTYKGVIAELDTIRTKLQEFDGTTSASYSDILDDDGNSVLQYNITSS